MRKLPLKRHGVLKAAGTMPEPTKNLYTKLPTEVTFWRKVPKKLISRLNFSAATTRMSERDPRDPLDNGSQANCTTHYWTESRTKWPSKPKFSTHVIPADLTEDPRLERPTGQPTPPKKVRDFPINTIIPHDRKTNTTPSQLGTLTPIDPRIQPPAAKPKRSLVSSTHIDPRSQAFIPRPNPSAMRQPRHEQLMHKQALGKAIQLQAPPTNTNRKSKGSRNIAISIPNQASDKIAKKNAKPDLPL